MVGEKQTEDERETQGEASAAEWPVSQELRSKEGNERERGGASRRQAPAYSIRHKDPEGSGADVFCSGKAPSASPGLRPSYATAGSAGCSLSSGPSLRRRPGPHSLPLPTHASWLCWPWTCTLTAGLTDGRTCQPSLETGELPRFTVLLTTGWSYGVWFRDFRRL